MFPPTVRLPQAPMVRNRDNGRHRHAVCGSARAPTRAIQRLNLGNLVTRSVSEGRIANSHPVFSLTLRVTVELVAASLLSSTTLNAHEVPTVMCSALQSGMVFHSRKTLQVTILQRFRWLSTTYVESACCQILPRLNTLLSRTGFCDVFPVDPA